MTLTFSVVKKHPMHLLYNGGVEARDYSGKILLGVVVGALFLVGLSFVGMLVFPWSRIEWGTLRLAPSRTITVTGSAEKEERNQIAAFTAGVTVVDDNKDAAFSAVNQKIEGLIDALKAFGIDASDIKTQNVSVYQEEETYAEEGRQKRRPGQWRVSNSITVTVRNVDRADAVADLLTKSGATNVSGPNFSLDETTQAENTLLSDAIEDARKKAEVIASASGGTVGKVMNVTEGSSPIGIPLLSYGAGGGGIPLEPGSSTIRKTVTVTFAFE